MHWKNIYIKCLLASATLLSPLDALAWKPTTHVYLGKQALDDALDDGRVTINRVDYKAGKIVGTVGTYEVDPSILAALKSNSDQYKAGLLGPDAYPDILTGQQVIHPSSKETGITGGSSGWLHYLWNLSRSSGSPAIQAFTVGYLTHAGGDMYGHTFINNFSGGSFAITPPEGPENAIKHVIIEGYIDKRIDKTVFGGTFFNASIDGVNNFIYQYMVDARPGTFLADNLLRKDGGGTSLSIPRIYSTLRAKLEADIKAYYDKKAEFDKRYDECSVLDFSCSKTKILAEKVAYVTLNAVPITYKEAWRDDIDSGLRAWPGVSHQVAQSLFFNPSRSADISRAMDIMENYALNHLSSMSGAPDFVGLTASVISSIVSAITPDFLLDPIRELKKDLLNSLLIGATGMSANELKEYLTSPEKRFDEVLVKGNGQNTNLQRFNNEYLKIADVGYMNPSENINPNAVPALYNTIVMSKLIMLNPTEINRLLRDLRSTSQLEQVNIMLGFLDTLDGSNQWYSGMAIAKDCNAYREIFMNQPGETSNCASAPPPLEVMRPQINPNLETNPTQQQPAGIPIKIPPKFRIP